MSIYINESLGLYPRHPGDIKLIDPDWEEGMPLPEGWEIVIANDPPEYSGLLQKCIELHPIRIDGVWHRQFEIVDRTQEEIDAKKEMMKKKFIEESVEE